MATITRRPSRSSSRIQAAPTYEGVASSFASSFQAAIKNERVSKFNNMVTAYKDGSVTFDEVKKFIDDYVTEVGANTSEGSDAIKTLVSLQDVERGRQRENKRTELEARYASSDGYISQQDRYRIESEMLGYEKPGTDDYTKQQQNVITAFENAQVELVEQRKAELFEQYMSGGVTPQEELAIVRELKTVANPESKAYQTLVQQEAQLVASVQREAAAGNDTRLQNEFSFLLADELANQQSVLQAHKLGEIDGLTLSEAQFDSADKLYNELISLAQQGVNVPEEALQQARQNMNNAAIMIQAYNGGQIFDVIARDGSVKTVTIDGKDLETGKDVEFMDEPVRLNPATGLWEVIDSAGNVVEGAAALGSKQAALARATELGLDTSFTTVIRNEKGQMERIRAKRNQDGTFTLMDADGEGGDAIVTSIPTRLDLFGSAPNAFKLLNPSDTSVSVDPSQIPKIQTPDIDRLSGAISTSTSQIDQLSKTLGIPSIGVDASKLDLGASNQAANAAAISRATAGKNLGFDAEGNLTQNGMVLSPVTFKPSEIAKDVNLSNVSSIMKKANPSTTPFGGTTNDVSAESLRASLGNTKVNLGPSIPNFGLEPTPTVSPVSLNLPEVKPVSVNFSFPSAPKTSALVSPSLNASGVPDLGLTQKSSSNQPSFFDKAKSAVGGLFDKFLGLFRRD